MEVIVEAAFILLQFLGEILLQFVFEILAEIGMRGVRESFRRPKPLHPGLAAIGYVLLGAGAGAVSVILIPELFIDTPAGRLVNLIVTPIAAGGFMVAVGTWRRRKDQELIRLDKFGYGFLFALAMALVRFVWGH